MGCRLVIVFTRKCAPIQVIWDVFLGIKRLCIVLAGFYLELAVKDTRLVSPCSIGALIVSLGAAATGLRRKYWSGERHAHNYALAKIASRSDAILTGQSLGELFPQPDVC